MTMARRGRGRSTSTGFDGRRAQKRSQGPGQGDHHPYWTWMMGNFTGEIPKKSLLITMVSCSRVSTKNPSTFKKPKGDVATEKHELSMLQSGQYPKVEKYSSMVQGAESWKWNLNGTSHQLRSWECQVYVTESIWVLSFWMFMLYCFHLIPHRCGKPMLSPWG